MKKRTLIIVSIVFIFAICLALLVDKLFWVIMPLLGASIFVYLAVRFSKSNWVSVVISLACILVFFAIEETRLSYLRHMNTAVSDSHGSKYILSGETTNIGGYNQINDPLLGFSAKHMKVQTASKIMARGEEIYDVLISWDEKGRRITPDNSATADNLIILLGCSYAFGAGIEDNETFGWKLSELLGPDFQVLNYSYSAYGSNQMLALLESDRMDYLEGKYENVIAFYLNFPEIERRSAGMARWDQRGPKYVLNEDGTVSYEGQYNTTFYASLFGQSELLRELKKRYVRYVHNDSMFDLHAAIILKSANTFNKKFKGDFITVVYPDYEQLKERLARNNMEIIDLDLYFDDYESNMGKYTLSKYDAHPNAEANTVIAEAIYEYLEKNPQ